MHNKNNFTIENDYAKALNFSGDFGILNSILQCLGYVEDLATYFVKHFQDTLSNKSKKKLSNAYSELLFNIWRRNSNNFDSSKHLQIILKEINPLYDSVPISSPKTFILLFMETIHYELNKPKNNYLCKFDNKNDYNLTFKAFSKYFCNNFLSIISKLFYGSYNKEIKCLNCNYKYNNIQIFNILTFPLNDVKKYKNKIENEVSIIECFDYYQREEIMKEGNQIYCNNCHSMANCLINSKLIFTPKILIINLINGKELKIKIEKNIYIRDYVYIKNHIYLLYELIGIISLSNNSNVITFCKSFVTKEWVNYKNKLYNCCTFDEAISTGTPYFLFYSAKTN